MIFAVKAKIKQVEIFTKLHSGPPICGGGPGVSALRHCGHCAGLVSFNIPEKCVLYSGVCMC